VGKVLQYAPRLATANDTAEDLEFLLKKANSVGVGTP
jgi:hypothetical protein